MIDRWIVRCRVSGGVTGTRESVLKARAGDVQYFDDERAAGAEAARLTVAGNADRYRTAYFQYWPARADGGQ